MIHLLLLLACQQWKPDDDHEDLLWPLDDGSTAPLLRATYLQAEGPGSVKLHAGVDMIPSADRTVWALEDGTVVRIEGKKENGKPESKVAGMIIASKKKPGRAFLYLHLDPGSIDLEELDEVSADEELGQVRAEDPSTSYPEHLHLARIAGLYEDIAWDQLDRLSVRNPLDLVDESVLEDSRKPEILSMGKTPFHFRLNEDPSTSTTTKLPGAIPSATMVDVVAQVRDGSDASSDIAPYELELRIRSGGKTHSFLLLLDGPPPTSASVLYNIKDPSTSGVGGSDPAYFLNLTNGSDGSTFSMDKMRAWCTSKGSFDLELVVKDLAGNASLPVKATVDIP
jgi:hypothetical protein